MKATEDKPKAKILREDSDDDFFIELCLKGSKDLRDKLGADEQIFYSHPAHLSNPREYYLYSVLNEIEKAGTTLMRIREFASEGEVDDSHSAKNIIEAQLDETYLWLRKLTEILVELMLFKTTNEVDYYRHYIIIQHLKELNHTIDN